MRRGTFFTAFRGYARHPGGALCATARQGFVNHAQEWRYFALPDTVLRGYDFPPAPRDQAGGVKSPMFAGSKLIQRRFCSAARTDRWT
jgi:hypothetical protein